MLLAGGFGTRLRPLTLTVPKCLVEIGDQPLLSWWLDALERANIGTALVNTHHLRDAVQSYIARENKNRSLDLIESYEPELLGSAGTVHANRDFADDADIILVIYADNLSTLDLGALLNFHKDHADPFTMALFHTPFPKQCGIATLDDAARITKFEEKPENPPSDLANAGIYAIDASAWRDIADMDVFDFGFDVLPTFVGKMRGYAFDGYHRDIGTPEALDQARLDADTLRQAFA